MTDSDLYDQRADEARREADSAILANVRDRALRSEEAWRAMAARSRAVGENRLRNEAEKAQRALLP